LIRNTLNDIIIMLASNLNNLYKGKFRFIIFKSSKKS